MLSRASRHASQSGAPQRHNRSQKMNNKAEALQSTSTSIVPLLSHSTTTSQ